MMVSGGCSDFWIDLVCDNKRHRGDFTEKPAQIVRKSPARKSPFPCFRQQKVKYLSVLILMNYIFTFTSSVFNFYHA